MASANNEPQNVADSVGVAALIAAQSAAIARIRVRLLAQIRQAWRAQKDYRSPERFVAAVVPLVRGAQRQTASTTAAYLSQLYGRLDGTPVHMVGVPSDVAVDVRTGVDPAEVYARPFHQVWRELHDLPREPGSIDQAIADGLKYAESLAATDVQLAKTHAAQHVIGQQRNVTGYRRVLEGGYSCGLCIVAATQRYHKADLLPVHPACDCSVEPLVGLTDELTIGAVVRDSNGELVPLAQLADVHDRIAETFGRDSSAARIIPGARGSKGEPITYSDVLITHDHGELGPVLSVRGQNWTGPEDLSRIA